MRAIIAFHSPSEVVELPQQWADAFLHWQTILWAWPYLACDYRIVVAAMAAAKECDCDRLELVVNLFNLIGQVRTT